MDINITYIFICAALFSSSISLISESQISQLVQDYHYCILGEITEINVRESELSTINFSISKILAVNLSSPVKILYNETAMKNNYNITLKMNTTYLIFLKHKGENFFLPSDNYICPIITPDMELIEQIEFLYSKKAVSLQEAPKIVPNIEPELNYNQYLSITLIFLLVILSLIYIWITSKKHV